MIETGNLKLSVFFFLIFYYFQGKLPVFERHSCTNEWTVEIVGKGLRETPPASTGNGVSYPPTCREPGVCSRKAQPFHLQGGRGEYEQSLSCAHMWGSENTAGNIELGVQVLAQPGNYLCVRECTTNLSNPQLLPL